jgi:hypothetical protein
MDAPNAHPKSHPRHPGPPPWRFQERAWLAGHIVLRCLLGHPGAFCACLAHKPAHNGWRTSRAPSVDCRNHRDSISFRRFGRFGLVARRPVPRAAFFLASACSAWHIDAYSAADGRIQGQRTPHPAFLAARAWGCQDCAASVASIIAPSSLDMISRILSMNWSTVNLFLILLQMPQHGWQLPVV